MKTKASKNHHDASSVLEVKLDAALAPASLELAQCAREDRGTATILHNEVLTRLRAHIVEGNLKEGERIPERQLCDLFGVSRTPLREALKVLASEDLIELLPNRGARVKAVSLEDIREMLDVMCGLEALAGRLACKRATDREIAEIESLHYEMYRHYLRRELPGYFRCNQLIHEGIVNAARNAALHRLYFSYGARLWRIRYSANDESHRDRWSDAMREHEAILHALQRRAGPEMGNLLFEHLQNKQQAIADNKRLELEQGSKTTDLSETSSST